MEKKSENFKRIAENRVNKIISLISKLQNLTNTSFYEYEEEQIDNMFSMIEEELNKQRQEFKKKSRKKRFEL